MVTSTPSPAFFPMAPFAPLTRFPAATRPASSEGSFDTDTCTLLDSIFALFKRLSMFANGSMRCFFSFSFSFVIFIAVLFSRAPTFSSMMTSFKVLSLSSLTAGTAVKTVFSTPFRVEKRLTVLSFKDDFAPVGTLFSSSFSFLAGATSSMFLSFKTAMGLPKPFFCCSAPFLISVMLGMHSVSSRMSKSKSLLLVLLLLLLLLFVSSFVTTMFAGRRTVSSRTRNPPSSSSSSSSFFSATLLTT
mmetsp:Transcript_2309/g.7355  ORF Transcript_2309/g.7355 Transcript_2309/m.7355 type:complete len:245 (+) Transcript_2309:1054-1788(+)